jgi:hypothetical protein
LIIFRKILNSLLRIRTFKKDISCYAYNALVLGFVLFFCTFAAFASPNQLDDRPFTIVLLPDTQYYKDYPGVSRNHIFDSQTQWIADHLVDKNILLTLHLGDIVDISMESLWIDALYNLSHLDRLTPIILALGNHDIIELKDPGTSTYINSYELFHKKFPEDRFNKFPWFGGVFEKGNIENAYFLFNFAGVEYIVLALEYGPRDKVLDWANKIVEDFSTKKAIIVTHAYMAKGPKRLKAGVRFYPKVSGVPYDSKEYKVAGKDGLANGGDVIWNRLVKKHKNIEFVLSGHSKGPGKLISKGVNGNPVYQVGANYQWEENGGNGYLRLMKFYPKKKKVTVKTYSPLLDHFRTDWQNQFQIDLNKGKFLKLAP